MDAEIQTQASDIDSAIVREIAKQKDSIVKGMVQGAIESLQNDLKWKVGSIAASETDKFIKEHVLPELAKELQARRVEIINAMLGGITAALNSAGEQLIATAAKNMTQSWSVKKITEGLFG